MAERKQKILFIMQLPPPVHGVSVMNKLIHDSKLINEQLRCDYINLATARDIHDLQKNGLRKYFLTLGIAFRAFFKLLGNRYDHVYITIFPWGFGFIKDSIMVLLARLFRQNVLLHLHTYGFKRESEKSSLRKWFYRFVFKNTRVICLSDLLLEDVETIYKGPVYILPNGIPQVNFENTYKADQSPVSILYLSNLIKGKGILLIMDALHMLKKKGHRFLFRVVGSEGDVTYAMLRNVIQEKGLQEDVKLVGPKFGEEKFEEFKKAGMFLLPSNYDTFGLVLLEAMQYGVPCIASKMGGIPDVLGDGRGLIMRDITAESLAECIEQLLTDPSQRLLKSKLGFEYFKGNFTVEVFEKRLYNILRGSPDKINQRLNPTQA